jgi:hypothetical protein
MNRIHSALLAVALIAGTVTPLGCAGPAAQGDRVTAGMAERSIVIGQTTQQQILEAFGAPNIVTRGPKASENWTYERVSFDSSYVRGGVGGVAGGEPGTTIVGGAAGIGGGSSSSSMRTVTLIIYFDENEVVSDYRVMETHF